MLTGGVVLLAILLFQWMNSRANRETTASPAAVHKAFDMLYS